MTTIPLSLIDLRDLLTNYETTAALNAARSFEQRQLYWALDASVPNRIIPSALARIISSADPDGLVFHVQIKSLPATHIDQWTPTPEYGVVWAADDWRASAENRLSRSTSWLAEKADRLEFSMEQARRDRMIARIFTKLPQQGARSLKELIHNLRTEDELRSVMQTFETALNLPIYEEPTPARTPQSNQNVPSPSGGAAEGPAPALQETGGAPGSDDQAPVQVGQD